MAKIPREIMEHLPVWKAKHGEVFYLPKDESSGYILRTFNLREFEAFQAQAQINEGYAESQLLKACLLWPIDFDFDDPKFTQPAFQQLLESLHTVSPYDNPKRFMAKLKDKRARSESLIDAIYIHIAAAFPSMKLIDIQELSCDGVLHHLALAEKILQREIEIEGQGVKSSPTIVDPKQARAARHAERLKARRHAIATDRAMATGQPIPHPVDIPTDEDEGPKRLSLMADAAEMSKHL